MIVENSALFLAKQIKKHAPDHKASVDVLEYGLKIIVNAIFVVVLTIIINLLLKHGLTHVLIGTVSFAILRSVSGGYHIRSSDLCVIFSVAMLTTIQYLSEVSFINSLNILTIVLLILMAPRDMQIQSKIPVRFNFILKIVCVLIVIMNLICVKSNVVTAAFILQTLTLLKKNKVED